MPHFWKGDFKTGYVDADFETGFQSFISPMSPYLSDLIFLFIGYIVLKEKKITNSFVIGLVIVLLVLSPLYDVFNNYVGFALGAQSDFNGIRGTIGYFWTHTIGLLFTLTAMFTLWRVFVMFKKYPEE